MKSPKMKPNAYSAVKSSHIGSPSSPVTVAARMTPVASPATQWRVEPTVCFHNGLMNASCSPGCGSLSAMT